MPPSSERRNFISRGNFSATGCTHAGQARREKAQGWREERAKGSAVKGVLCSRVVKCHSILAAVVAQQRRLQSQSGRVDKPARGGELSLTPTVNETFNYITPIDARRHRRRCRAMARRNGGSKREAGVEKRRPLLKFHAQRERRVVYGPLDPRRRVSAR